MSVEPTTRAFLLLHGHQHHQPEGHWLWWLSQELREHGFRVSYPQLPDADYPRVDDWLAALHRCLDELRGFDVTVICHSLSTLLWLHAITSPLPVPTVDRVLLVAPPSASVVLSDPDIAAFAPGPTAAEHVRSAAVHRTRIVASDNDPYCPEGAEALFAAPLATELDSLPGQAHLDLNAGYGAWPALLQWCLDPTRRVYARTPDCASTPAGSS